MPKTDSKSARHKSPVIDSIVLRGARQNNLKNLSLELPVNKLIVITGVSGSGKSTLAFDTIYAEGQRRYVETFSAYARQFLDRMDKPAVDSIEGIPPAIAIDQTNPVRTSRSTVGTMTELNDYLKLVFARLSHLHCPGCGREVKRDSTQSIVAELQASLPAETRLHVCFPASVPHNFSEQEVRQWLNQQGYTRIQASHESKVHVVQDRLRLRSDNLARLAEAVETALHHGSGHVLVYAEPEQPEQQIKAFSSHLHCPDCEREFSDAGAGAFSFNSPIGACETCRGFGRIIDVDFDLVIPDHNKTLREGAIKIWQSKSFLECQFDLEKLARKRGIPLDTPWREMTAADRNWVLEGEGDWAKDVWYGVRRFFAWLESRAYKMHVRVLLSRYRAYTECHACHGARLKPESLWWRLHQQPQAAGETGIPDNSYTINELMQFPLQDCADFFEKLRLPGKLDAATELLIGEIRSRLGYLLDVGLGYLTLDRQSRTLSGGEVQRINLTTALGTSLVNTLFVLDEPSIGLHTRDMQRMVGILHRLRDAGNSLIVVEHDPQVMLAADLIIDIGPGPGKRGGEVRFMGTPAQLLKHKDSLTAKYLSSELLVAEAADEPLDAVAEPAAVYDFKKRVSSGQQGSTLPLICIRGARENNLKGVDVDIPLRGLVCLTGVSGSGKSTLMRDILYRGLCREFGIATEAPGVHDSLSGYEHISNIVFVDQSPLGKTTRSIPATYVGAFDVIRKRFVDQPLARERGYKPGIFSFNSGNGRCPVCAGNGFEHVEMQFLSDVYLRCSECNGKRYRREILEVTLLDPHDSRRALSIADVLELTVEEALAFFDGDAEVQNCLQPLLDVGLHYLQLGQAVPTLSGGESQRLKLAGHLAQVSHKKLSNKKPASKTVAGKKPSGNKTSEKGILFLFDEPTTGLHFHDIHVLLKAFRKLLDAGHSLLIIEHNLDVIRAADWLIEIGPEGGAEGGQLIAADTPKQFIASGKGHTAHALRDYEAELKRNQGSGKKRSTALKTLSGTSSTSKRVKPVQAIQIHHAREHNLKNIDVSLPWNQFTVITGVSGSGKSTLAFDLVFAEGQRRYLESLNAYARQFVQPASKPDVDAIHGIPPTVAIEQRTSRGGRKSTVATLTEIYHFLRLVFVKLGTQYCPDCDVPIEPQSQDMILSRLQSEWQGRQVTLLAPVVVGRKGLYKELAAWAANKGYTHLRADGKILPSNDWPVLDRYKEHDIEVVIGDCAVDKKNEAELNRLIGEALAVGNGLLSVTEVTTGKRRKKVKADALFSTRRACPGCGSSFDDLDPRLFSFNSRHGWCTSCFGTGEQLADFNEELTGEEENFLDKDDNAQPAKVCRSCNGSRLNPTALAVRFQNQSIAELTRLSVDAAATHIGKIKLDTKQLAIARDILPELNGRLHFLQKVGLGYLSLDRAAPTLSGGEAQRIRLASQLGSNLQGVCYILDEPTIGLHARDNALLIATLRELQQHGNTVIVVEHDDATMAEADHLIDVGPGAGVNGGEIVATGTLDQLKKNKKSLTGQFLANPMRHPLPDLRDDTLRQQQEKETLQIRGASQNNLRNVDIDIPLRQLVVVSGVSGGGKSTLIRGVLYDNLRDLVIANNKRGKAKGSKRKSSWQGCESIDGWQGINSVLQVDQTPIGKTPRSCPASYIGIWDTIRKLFADTVDARLRGYLPGRFSFNVSGGRCETCSGNGMQKIEMNFLPDVRVDCEACGGWRFNDETLSVQYKGKHIGEVLAMNVDEAVDFFESVPSVHHPLKLLQDVGVGYLTLGQQSPTLSGGEAQRIKLVAELAKAKPHLSLRGSKPPHKLYVLDEPTVGLHMADVEKLLRVLHRLVDAGNSVIVIEHNLDMIAEADWVIDMGPEGGDKGGKVVAQGRPEKVARSKRSHTGRYLAEMPL
ncbi:excinuclease ABC subunit UvrA [Pseudohongiella sp. SYSU M77423]|uniref:excinuclease ABC subunit UvrA n=1 Tax=Pseudohongiella sp. SYSU M77423 TaxID=3042312 RepID=UPI0024818130|nr:excinuclease ABC subunit UvrA [Pseudohongiella sp. SYSU M77423]MDH7944830.1 excinuclease ABC subunit UvrA [Pseudohongiella sp. SYSU M77423]